MEPDQTDPALSISNTKVFDYRREVIVELHGQTPDGEFEVVSYTFTADPDEKRRLRSPEVPAAHEEVVDEALAETDYTLT